MCCAGAAMTAGLDGGATAATLGVSAGVTYDGALTLLSGKRKGRCLPAFRLTLCARRAETSMVVLLALLIWLSAEQVIGLLLLLIHEHEATAGSAA